MNKIEKQLIRLEVLIAVLCLTTFLLSLESCKVKTETQAVKSKVDGETRSVGDAVFAVYDSSDEAIAQEGAERCLDYINAQVRTNEMNRIRALARGGPSKNKLRNMAISEITSEEWSQIAGDQAAIEAMLQTKCREIEARMATAPTEAVAVDDDEEE